MVKKILILGAGVYQLPLIERSKERGFEVHVASIGGTYPGINEADYFHEIDIKDSKRLIDLAKKGKYEGVLTCGTDICMPAIGKINDKLNLSGVSHNSALKSTDKVLMKETFKENKIPSPKFRKVTKIEEANRFFNKINRSCIIKPTNSSGSRGVSKVTKVSEIEDTFTKAQKISDEVIIEEWLDGMEYGAQVIVSKNSKIHVMIHSDDIIKNPVPIPVGHGMPHPKIKQIKTSTEKVIQETIKAFDLNSCIVNFDLIWHQDSPYIIELGARMGATCLPEVCNSWWAINLYDIAIDLAIGKNIGELPDKPFGKATYAHLLWSRLDGIINKIPHINEDFCYNLDISEGDEVFRFTSGNKRIGDIMKSGDDIERITKEVMDEAQHFNEQLGVMI